MAKIVIFEGNATSGKSILQNILADILKSKGKKVLVVDEKVITKSFIKSSTRNVAGSLKLLDSVIEKYFNKKYEYIIFDRFHFTHIVTLKTSFNYFIHLEDKLQWYDLRIVYLYYQPECIIRRIRSSAEIRNIKDIGYIKHLQRIIADAKTTEEENQKIQKYYDFRLKKYEDIIKKTKLPVLKLDVTDKKTINDYEKLIPQILKFIE